MEGSDENLVKDYLDGDDGAFKRLLDKYTSSVYNFSFRFVGADNANDVVQDVFIKVWKNLKKFNSEKSQFKTWLFTIARNTITDYLRKKKMVLFSSLDKEEEDFVDSLESEDFLPDEDFIRLEDKNTLNKLLNQIPENYKEILILHYQEDMTFNEIGKLMKKPLNTVKSYHRRALIKLKDITHQN